MGITIEVPDNLGLTDQEVKMMLAAKLFDQGLISSGQGARMVGISRKDFILQLGKYEVSIFSDDSEEIMRDVENAKRARNK